MPFVLVRKNQRTKEGKDIVQLCFGIGVALWERVGIFLKKLTTKSMFFSCVWKLPMYIVFVYLHNNVCLHHLFDQHISTRMFCALPPGPHVQGDAFPKGCPAETRHPPDSHPYDCQESFVLVLVAYSLGLVYILVYTFNGQKYICIIIMSHTSGLRVPLTDDIFHDYSSDSSFVLSQIRPFKIDCMFCINALVQVSRLEWKKCTLIFLQNLAISLNFRWFRSFSWVST